MRGLSNSRITDRRVVVPFVGLILFIFLYCFSGAFLIDSLPVFNRENLLPQQLYYQIFPSAILCPLISPKLVGWTDLSFKSTTAILNEDENEVELRLRTAGVKPGGRYEPSECQSRNKVAIIVPIRNRQDHLTVFLRYLHPFLQRQQLSYVIVVVEQSERSAFNRGMLINIGFKEVQQLGEQFPCVILHDVDMLPEDDGNSYTCAEEGKPRQMAYSIDYAANYKPTPWKYFGGVTAFAATDFQRINGFSNSFWGWGGEDDQLYQRVLAQNLTVTRPFDGQETPVAHYKTLSHKKASPNPDRMKVIEEGSARFKMDGLIDLKYERLDMQLKPLYTRILVDIQPGNTA